MVPDTLSTALSTDTSDTLSTDTLSNLHFSFNNSEHHGPNDVDGVNLLARTPVIQFN